MELILTVTPNACVDKTYQVNDFILNRVHRPEMVHTVAGGKGINLARVFQTLGGSAFATGFLGGDQGKIISKALEAERIANRFVWVDGNSRQCIAIVDPLSRTQTEINETGAEVTSLSVSELLSLVHSLLSQHAFEFVTLCGSLPPGAPLDLYAELITLARNAGVKSVLDTSGEPLRLGIAARPWMIKPNRAEFEALYPDAFGLSNNLDEAAQNLLMTGIAVVCITHGETGATLWTERGRWKAQPPKIDFVSAVASGDSFLAAYLWSWLYSDHPESEKEALRLATGAGAANAAIIGAGFCTREAIIEMSEHVDVNEVSSSRVI